MPSASRSLCASTAVTPLAATRSPAATPPPNTRREVSEVDHLDAAQAVRRVLEAAAPLGVRPRADRAAGEPDPTVAEGVQVRHGLADAVGVVDHDRRQPGVQAVDQQQRARRGRGRPG